MARLLRVGHWINQVSITPAIEEFRITYRHISSEVNLGQAFMTLRIMSNDTLLQLHNSRRERLG
jgi:hypothetical protein